MSSPQQSYLPLVNYHLPFFIYASQWKMRNEKSTMTNESSLEVPLALSPSRAGARGAEYIYSTFHLTLVHDEVLGRGRRLREGGRRVVPGPAFGVVFSVSLTPEED
jgi:hypothetical protein